jgi:hypothetical protein
MDKSLFSGKPNYTKRFLEKHSRRFQLPHSVIIDSKFHPVHKDHIVTLAMNCIPEDIKNGKVKVRMAVNDNYTTIDSYSFNDK